MGLLVILKPYMPPSTFRVLNYLFYIHRFTIGEIMMNTFIIGGIPLLPAVISYLLWTWINNQIILFLDNMKRAISTILTIQGIISYNPRLIFNSEDEPLGFKTGSNTINKV